jgi:hypothetical protein
VRQRERRRVFNISELKRLAALAIHQKEADVIEFQKLAEGGFNRSFLITMRDGYQLVARDSISGYRTEIPRGRE